MHQSFRFSDHSTRANTAPSRVTEPIPAPFHAIEITPSRASLSSVVIIGAVLLLLLLRFHIASEIKPFIAGVFCVYAGSDGLGSRGAFAAMTACATARLAQQLSGSPHI